jgi:hypothetical protein
VARAELDGFGHAGAFAGARADRELKFVEQRVRVNSLEELKTVRLRYREVDDGDVEVAGRIVE